MPFTITAAELASANAKYAELQAELAIAEAEAQAASAAAWDQPGTDQLLFRRAHDLGRNAATLRTRLNSLAAFLQSADVDDVDPDPDPTPPAPAAKMLPPINGRGRTIIARMHGTCRLCQGAITPGQMITQYMSRGCWAHTEEVVAREAAHRECRNDRELAAMYVAFIDRLPIAA